MLTARSLVRELPLTIAAAVGVSIAAAACVAGVIWQLLVDGPFDWHVQQPQTWQGGIDSICLVILLALAAALRNTRWRLIFCGAIALLYLRRHAVDVPLLVDVFYIEAIIAVGFV
jgi:hypothetical protein